MGHIGNGARTMEHDRYEGNDAARDWAQPRPGPDDRLTDHLWRLALPHLQGALHDPALVHVVRELSPSAPLAGLAQALADDALRRALRLVGGARSYQHEAGSTEGWQLAYDAAIVELANTAMSALRGLRAGVTQVH
jgi:hypothetical protein